MTALSSELRGVLERAVLAGRAASEAAAEAALNTIGLTTAQPYASLTEEQRRLRVALRARARQLGEGSVENGRHLLVEEVAYEQWHRMLFARFLAENGLLMYPGAESVAVTLEECAELAPEEGEPDAWSLAARYASAMLPGIFQKDDPSARVRFAPEGRNALERILNELPPAVFQADDALGWVYQFWQGKAKKAVNESGVKIGAKELPAVTQLFTEDYMVRFLLENSLGAWWAARHPQSPLIKEWEYLRFKNDGTPAAGTFPSWPDRAAEVTVMDPCCGSGHFLVAALGMLRQMRMEEERLAGVDAGDAVLGDNVFGLEIDPRCTQIAAFALAFAAWKASGYRQLPPLNIACSGIPVKGQLEEWTKLAGDDVNLRLALQRLYTFFNEAPTLGSLINPAEAVGPLFTPEWTTVEPLLHAALAKGKELGDPTAEVSGVAAAGAVGAAALLGSRYTFVATNVPYLGRGEQSELLRSYLEAEYNKGKQDLATAFVQRCVEFVVPSGAVAIVTPENWLSQVSYASLRRALLGNQSFQMVSLLGEEAWQSFGIRGPRATLLILRNAPPAMHQAYATIDVSSPPGHQQVLLPEKIAGLKSADLREVDQRAQLGNPDARITLTAASGGPLLSKYATGLQGIASGDYPRFGRCFWELDPIGPDWEFQQSGIECTTLYGGREHILYWQRGVGALGRSTQARVQGLAARGKLGVAVQQMRRLTCTLYTGELFDNNVAIILPSDPAHVPAIWAYCSSPEFQSNVRSIDRKSGVTNATLVKVPFDVRRWQKVAEEMGPLPEPYSNDPTQWLFKGGPADSTDPLQVAVARLLGYRWPDQEKDHLDALADGDGIVPLVPVLHEQPAAERLRVLLATAFGDAWSTGKQDALLAQPGYSGKDLGMWLRDGFFSQHAKLFHNRPFIWHIWDGVRDGFSVLVNYHKLDATGLNRLIYTYLGSWVETQRAAQAAGEPGADGRLVAALELKRKLQLIAEGEPRYDIYVRWKPLHEQPIGWNPDLNDGVRLNIRPFVEAKVLRSKFTINWNKDRGTNPDGSERLNDLHFTVAEKRDAREAAGMG